MRSRVFICVVFSLLLAVPILAESAASAYKAGEHAEKKNDYDTAYQAFYDALPIAGVDGTIADRMRGTPAAGNVHAKTGFVDRARSLSGYVTTADGEGLVFSFLCNNWTTPVHDVERVQDEIAVRLASMTVGAP